MLRDRGEKVPAEDCMEISMKIKVNKGVILLGEVWVCV